MGCIGLPGVFRGLLVALRGLGVPSLIHLPRHTAALYCKLCQCGLLLVTNDRSTRFLCFCKPFTTSSSQTAMALPAKIRAALGGCFGVGTRGRRISKVRDDCFVSSRDLFRLSDRVRWHDVHII